MSIETNLDGGPRALDFAREAEKAYAERLPDGWTKIPGGFRHIPTRGSWYVGDSVEPDQRNAYRALFDYLDRLDQNKSEG